MIRPQTIQNIMIGKGSKLYSMGRMKCPKCHEGNLYKTSLISMQGIYNMHKKCTECNQPFELEPGFYWGAMYIGYMMSSGYMLVGAAVLMAGFGLGLGFSFGLLIFFGLIALPAIARLARSIWINFYVSYNKDAIKNVNTGERK
ncbi:MAG: DUF983 domain-containing protein [Aureispira sp.]|nr:DUF983 domain-containing protein [Aureispira sp.]